MPPMATIDVRRKHSVGKDGARAAAEEIAGRMEKQLGGNFHWDGDALKFKRSGASGEIHVADDEVRVSVDLGLMYRPMKGMIEGKINEYLDEKFS